MEFEPAKTGEFVRFGGVVAQHLGTGRGCAVKLDAVAIACKFQMSVTEHHQLDGIIFGVSRWCRWR